MIIALILLSIQSTLQQPAFALKPGVELGASSSEGQTRSIYYLDLSAEELETARLRMVRNRERQASFAAAVYRRDSASARVKLFESLDGYGETASFSRESLKKLPTNALTVAGDFCLDAGDLDGARLVAELVLERHPLEDGLLFTEFVRIKSGTPTTEQSQIAKGLLLAIAQNLRNDLNAALADTATQAQVLSRVSLARGLIAAHEGDLERAAYHYQLALESDPGSAFGKLFYSRVLLDSGAIEQGKEHLRALLASPYVQIAREARRLLDGVGG